MTKIINSGTCNKMAAEAVEHSKKAAQNVQTKFFGIKSKSSITEDTPEFSYVITKSFWNKLLPKSMQKYTKTKLSTDKTRKIEESVFKGKTRIEHTLWNENNQITYHETYNPKTKIKQTKEATKNGYNLKTYENGILKYEECDGTWGRKLKQGEFHPYQYLLHVDEPQKIRAHITYDAEGKRTGTEMYAKYKDENGIERQYLKYKATNMNMTEFNPDGTLKSHIKYTKKLDEYKSYEKNPYWETYTQTDANGKVIGKIEYNCGSLWRKQRTIPTENGYIKEMSDYIQLKAHCRKVVNNDGSFVETMKYYQERIGGKITDIRTRAKDGSETYRILHGNIETDFYQYDKNGNLIYERIYSLSKKETVERHFSFGNIVGGIKGPILEQVKVTKNINGKDETRYYNGKYQRINPDGTKYRYSSEQECAAEWYKQEKEADYKTNDNNNSSRTERTRTTTAGEKETRDEFIIRIRDFLSSRGKKILNERDLRNLAKVMGVEKPELLTKFGDKNNAEAKNLYRRLCIKYHPDTNNGNPVKQNLFIIVQNLRTI